MASFASTVKNELSKLPLGKDCCVIAETLALFRMGGSITLSGGQLGGVFETKNAGIAHRFLSLIRRNRVRLVTETAMQKNLKLQKGNNYQLRLLASEDSLQWLKKIGLLGDLGFNRGSDKRFLRKQCCQRAYLRGAFLGGGSVNKPEGRYHLELVTGNDEYAETLQELIGKFGFNARISERKEECVIYLKEGDAITHFLQIVEATEALLNFENVRIVKERREYVNRAFNCEIANVQKTVNAAVRHLGVIEALEEQELLDKLPLALREVAYMRLKYPEDSLKDLAERFPNKISKSGLNHRLKKLEIAGKALMSRGD